jgi:hypothetical protein
VLLCLREMAGVGVGLGPAAEGTPQMSLEPDVSVRKSDMVPRTSMVYGLWIGANPPARDDPDQL